MPALTGTSPNGALRGEEEGGRKERRGGRRVGGRQKECVRREGGRGRKRGHMNWTERADGRESPLLCRHENGINGSATKHHVVVESGKDKTIIQLLPLLCFLSSILPLDREHALSAQNNAVSGWCWRNHTVTWVKISARKQRWTVSAIDRHFGCWVAHNTICPLLLFYIFFFFSSVSKDNGYMLQSR